MTALDVVICGIESVKNQWWSYLWFLSSKCCLLLWLF